MAFNDLEKKRIENALDKFLTKRRPPPHIRNEVDIGYRLSGQSVELLEIRPQWDDPKICLLYTSLQAGSHPGNLPAILNLDVSGLGERAPMDDRRIVPLRANFEKFDTLAGQTVAEVEFLADVGWRPPLGQEFVQGVLDPLFLKVVEGHRFNCLGEFS